MIGRDFFGLYDVHIRSAERQIVRIPADFLHLLQIDIAEEQMTMPTLPNGVRNTLKPSLDGV